MLAKWRRRARWLHPRVARVGQRVSLIICGVSPVEDAGIPGIARTWAWILRSPDYQLEPIPWMRVASIGSGNNVERYRERIQGINEDPVPHFSAEIGAATGMMATVLGMSFGSIVTDVPSPGVSPHFIVCTVQRGGFDVRTNDSVVYEEGGPRPERTMPSIATTWSEVVDLMRRNSVAEDDQWQAEA